MLVLEKEEFDLNLLLSFDNLKLILLKLAKSQNKLEEEIKTMQQNNLKRDEIIFNIRKEVTKYNNIGDNYNIKTDLKDEKIDDNKHEDVNNNQKDIKKDLNLIENIKNDNLDHKIDKFSEKNGDINQPNIEIKDNKEKEKTDSSKEINTNNINKYPPNINNDLNNKNQNISTEKHEQNISPNNEIKDVKLKELSLDSKNLIKDTNKEKEKDENIDDNFNSQDASQILNQLKEMRVRIITLEKKLLSKDTNVQKIENSIKINVLDNESKMKNIKEQLDSLFKNNQNILERIEKLEVKTSDMDILSMFKDSGDGNIDMTKVLVKSLEEKVFKKFNLLDEKYKKDSADNMKLKTSVENIIPRLDQMSRDIEKLNEVNLQNNDNFNLYKKENDEKINDINKINEDITKKIKEIKNEIEKEIKNKISDLDKNVNDLIKKNSDNNNLDFLKLSLGNSVDGEKLEMLSKKINELRTKMNNLENTLKLQINSNEIDSIKNEIKDMKLILDKKIGKDDLKELYNFHLSTKDEINDIKERETMTREDLTKTMKDLQNLQLKIESINGNLSLLLDNPKKESIKMIDFSKYIDDKKFSDTLKPILKELEKIFKEIDSLKNELAEVGNKNSNTLKSAINLIEDDIDNKFNDLKKAIQKKYLEKFEFHKTIKSLEIQIKSNSEDKKKPEGDSWLLAKRPMNCFNCASCEANIKNEEYIPADYLAWKKYPRGEKIHRMGQGFSHMLEMMTSEFIKNIEKNEFQNDNEISSRNANNTNLSTSPSYKINVNSVILNNKDKDDSIGFKKKTKFILPKMNATLKNKIKLIDGENLPVSDEENNDFIISENRAKETEANKDINTPKILKITKKGKPNISEIAKNKGLFKNLVTVQNVFTPRDKNNQNE